MFLFEEKRFLLGHRKIDGGRQEKGENYQDAGMDRVLIHTQSVIHRTRFTWQVLIIAPSVVHSVNIGH